jgi:NAD(P)-dependent dehydrogenase (short-subunit alcohol dehydrogenase family)
MSQGTVLITGANRGIGLALAKLLAAQGWEVLAGARQPAAAHDLETASREASPGTISVLPLDVRDDESVRLAAEEAGRLVRDLDVLVNNAGVLPEQGNEPLEELQLDCFEEAFATNVVGVARVTRHFLPLLGRSANPRVINISSLLGSVSTKENSTHYCYSASKAALNMLTRSMAAELRLRGITVVAITPGWVRTSMGGAQAALSAEESARSLAATITRLTAGDAGQFLDRDGQRGVAAW